jgi:cell division protease FtsH
VSLASLAGERMFFDEDSSSGVSGDLESATTVASYMEGFWGMGTTVSSYSTAKRLEVGSPGGGAGGRLKKGQDTEGQARQALADRIEENLKVMLDRTEELIRENRSDVLALAHALERHKTLSGEDVVAVLEHTRGPVVDGAPYGDPAFVAQLSDYHLSAARAHREHSQEQLRLPVPANVQPWSLPVAVAEPDGPGLNGHNPADPGES